MFQDVLAWQVIVPKAPMPYHQPLGVPQVEASPLNCDFSYFVDANTDEYMEAYQPCSPDVDEQG